MTLKSAKINLQTSVLPIWNPENKDYKIGYKKSQIRSSRVSKNSSENNFRILLANTVESETENISILDIREDFPLTRSGCLCNCHGESRERWTSVKLFIITTSFTMNVVHQMLAFVW